MIALRGTAVVYAVKSAGGAYVGHSRDIEQRRRSHLSALRNGHHPNKPLQSAWDVEGEEAFEIVVLEEVAPEDLIVAEQRWIDACGTYNAHPATAPPNPWGTPLSPEHVANISAGHLGIIPSPDGLVRRAAAHSREPHSPETRAKIGAAHRGKPLSPEHRAKLSAAGRGRGWTPEQRANQVAARTPERKAALSAAISAAWTAERRASNSARMRSANPMKSPGVAAKNAAARVGRVVSTETRARLAAGQLAYLSAKVRRKES